MTMRRRRSGFTFIELTVVAIIVLMVVATSLPRLRGTLARSQLTSAARDVAATLRLARDVAVLSERACEVRFAPNGDYYQLVVFDKDGRRLRLDDRRRSSRGNDAGDVISRLVSADMLQPQRLPSRVHFQAVYAAATLSVDDRLPRVVFYPDGSTSPTTIAIQNDDKAALRVEVYRMTGMTRVETGLPPADEGTTRKNHYGPGE
jgi:type II secretion system protein H